MKLTPDAQPFNTGFLEQDEPKTMQDVRAAVDALDDVLVPLLVKRSRYMTWAAKIKNDEKLVRDEARIEAIVRRVRDLAQAQNGSPDLMENLYRAMMECYIAYEFDELERMRQQ